MSITASAAALTSCAAPAGDGPDAAKQRMLAALPRGWALASVLQGSRPFEQQPTDQGADGTGVELILRGPRTIRVEGYYCDGAYCAVQAKEALEVWIMPAGYHDRRDVPMLQAWRVPERIAHDGKVQVFALASRDWGAPNAFDQGYTGSSHETPGPPRADGDLPLSWVGWRKDILAALAKDRR